MGVFDAFLCFFSSRSELMLKVLAKAPGVLVVTSLIERVLGTSDEK